MFLIQAHNFNKIMHFESITVLVLGQYWLAMKKSTVHQCRYFTYVQIQSFVVSTKDPDGLEKFLRKSISIHQYVRRPLNSFLVELPEPTNQPINHSWIGSSCQSHRPKLRSVEIVNVNRSGENSCDYRKCLVFGLLVRLHSLVDPI